MLASLQAHFTILDTPAEDVDVGYLLSLVVSGDRLGRGLALRPLAWFTWSDLYATLLAFARSGDPLLREQAIWALADRTATTASVRVVVAAIAAGGMAATIA